MTTSIWPPWSGDDVEVFGDRRVLAVGHAVLAQVSGAHVRRDDGQRPAWRCRRTAAAAAGRSHCAVESPCHVGGPAGAAAGANRKSRVCVPASVSSLQRGVVLPGDVNASGHAHDRGGAIRLALVAGGLVGGRIPGVDDLAALPR